MVVGTILIAVGLTLLDRHCQGFLRYGAEVNADYARRTRLMEKSDDLQSRLMGAHLADEFIANDETV